MSVFRPITTINLWRSFKLMGVDYDKLHLGSGQVILSGWLNIDFDINFGRDIFPLDLTKPLPFPDSSVSLIFSEHLIEHLPKDQGLHLLKECRRVLKKGGKIRFGFPDFTKLLHAYQKKDEKYRRGMLKHMGLNRTDSWDEFTADCLFSWDHRYFYTPKLIQCYLKFAGFKKANINEFNKSKLGFIWDTRNDPDTTYVEAAK